VSARRMSAEASNSAVKNENHRKARRRKESRGRRAIMKGSLRWVKRKTTGAVGLVEFVTWVLERGSNRTGRDGTGSLDVGTGSLGVDAIEEVGFG
jgi:hypothetical protein